MLFCVACHISKAVWWCIHVLWDLYEEFKRTSLVKSCFIRSTNILVNFKIQRHKLKTKCCRQPSIKRMEEYVETFQELIQRSPFMMCAPPPPKKKNLSYRSCRHFLLEDLNMWRSLPNLFLSTKCQEHFSYYYSDCDGIVHHEFVPASKTVYQQVLNVIIKEKFQTSDRHASNDSKTAGLTPNEILCMGHHANFSHLNKYLFISTF